MRGAGAGPGGGGGGRFGSSLGNECALDNPKKFRKDKPKGVSR